MNNQNEDGLLRICNKPIFEGNAHERDQVPFYHLPKE
jgi:hypothetical protein